MPPSSDQLASQRPTAAGMYDYYLGGNAHSPADRAAAEQMTRVLPDIVDTAWSNRGFLQRAVSRMAGEWGIHQFLDIGSGLPTARNTHDVVDEVIPDGGRVVYVDNDPVAVARSKELLAGVPNAAMIEGDVRDPDPILDHPDARRLIDLTQPVGLLLVAVLHFVPDDDDPWSLVARYVDAIASGSYLALSHVSADHLADHVRPTGRQIYGQLRNPPVTRSKAEVGRFLRGLELVAPHAGAEPGLTFQGIWGAEDPAEADTEGSRLGYAAVGRKP